MTLSTVLPLHLYVFDGGVVNTRGVKFVDPDGRETSRDMADPTHAYLIQHPHGWLMWDSGLSDRIADLPHQTRSSGRFDFVVTNPLAYQFDALGIDPAEVDFLAFSHLQVDHAGNAGFFPKADVLLQKAEYDHAFGPEAAKRGYVLSEYESITARKLVLLDGDLDVFGDGSVVILAAPGHTPGHQVLFVNLPVSGPLLLSGDLYYAAQDPAESWMPDWNDNRAQTLLSMQRLQAFAAAHHAHWLINHASSHPAAGWME